MHKTRTQYESDDVQAFSNKNVCKAWEHFLDSKGKTKEIPVRNLITSSWSRCLTGGVKPEQMIAPLLTTEDQLRQHRQKNTSFLEASQSVLENAKVMLQGLGTLVVLADDKGLNLQVVGDGLTVERGAEIGLSPGYSWEENHAGSNALGTAIATGRPTQVHGEEHFCKGFKPWTCTAANITDPYDDQLLGVINISGLSHEFNQFHVPLVMSWVNEVRLNLNKIASEQWRLIEEYAQQRAASYHNCERLLFDSNGRLINHSQTVRATLKSLSHYNLSLKQRLSFERFGGKEIIQPHSDGRWLSNDWVEPIKHKGEIIGFQVTIPNGKKGIRKTAPSPSTDISKLAENNIDGFSNMHTKTASFAACVDKARMAAASPLPILLLGDTGVGKEIFAQAIHKSSNYSKGNFVDLNCGGFSKEMLNSELFGYGDAAFTGAKKGGMIGKIEAANGGTLFLDEIGEMPLEIQPIFLRVLQERKIYRMGDVKPIPIDFRLIAATNRDLKKDVQEGLFRKDLYFRLSTVSISLDPLSGRKQDIEGISLLVLNRVRKDYPIIPKYFSPSLVAALMDTEWSGNIRELVNVVEYMCFMSQNETLTVGDLPDEYKPWKAVANNQNISAKKSLNLDIIEQLAIKKVIEQSDSNITLAAKTLGIAKSTLYLKIKKYGLGNL